ncbi:MAG TPA: ABC transporter ATP-binding protein [Anaerolineales bacterium]|nr:ABC transporter ATP-binding protein [Anaerolineales bacterium]
METARNPIPAWKYILALARYRLPLYLASGLLASILFYLFPLIPGLIVREVFDLLTIEGQTPAAARGPLLGLVWLLIGWGIARVIVIVMAGVAETSLHVVVNTLLQRNLLRHVLRRPGGRALPHSPGEAVARFRDDVEQVPAFLSWSIDPVGQALGIGVGVYILAQIDAGITLAVFLPLAAVVFVINLATKRIRAYRRAAQESIGSVTGLVGEIFGAVTVVKLSGAEEQVVSHLDELNEHRRAVTLRDTLFSEFLSTISYNMGNLGTGVLLLAAAGEMSAGRFTVGDFTLFVLYVQWLTFITGMFGSYLARYRQVGVSLERLLELMEGAAPMDLVAHRPLYLLGALPPLDGGGTPDGEPFESLVVKGLTYIFPETGRGVQNVSFETRAGELTVITGRIGSGKSTVVRALLGLLPAEGRLVWNGVPVNRPADFFVPPQAAYTPQVPRLFSEPLRDNILMGIEAGEGRMDRAVRSAVMEEDLKVLDDGLETVVGPRGVRLSGGQRQRVAAARMFAREPHLLVFDDLSSALDVETEGILWARLFDSPPSLSAGMDPRPAVIAVSHRRAVLQRADRIVLMEAGEVIGVGRLAELMAAHPEMRSLWEGIAL